MKQSYSVKIDAYSHIVPPKYSKTLSKIAPEQYGFKVAPITPLYDLDARFRIMDKFEPIRQVLTLAWPSPEEVAKPAKAAELAMMANDEMAELVLKYPDRFVSAIAILPMNNIDAALKEADRAIKDLKFRGVYVHTPAAGKPLDAPEILPLYEKMSQYDLPIFIHPMLSPTDQPDYKGENASKYLIFSTFGWPYETTKAMARLVFSGILQRYPNLKIVTHHAGGMVPYYAERIRQFMQGFERRGTKEEQLWLTRDSVDYFKMFYNDTAVYGNPKALECACDFFGADHLLFGADFPLGDIESGSRNYRQTINAIDQMDIAEEERKKIFEDNARKLMRLQI
ncbi:MAG: amidohydrolase [Dehalococcoidales bacterium]|nr:amidohydrolase [Dehalococcoidales bacterium]